jgi:hypothetical protein
MRKKLKLSSDGGNSGSKVWKRSYGGDNGGEWRLLLVGVWSQAAGFVLGCLVEIDFSRHKDGFPFYVFFVNKFYKFWISNAICEDSATIDCITVKVPINISLQYSEFTFVLLAKQSSTERYESPLYRHGVPISLLGVL